MHGNDTGGQAQSSQAVRLVNMTSDCCQMGVRWPARRTWEALLCWWSCSAADAEVGLRRPQEGAARCMGCKHATLLCRAGPRHRSGAEGGTCKAVAGAVRC